MTVSGIDFIKRLPTEVSIKILSYFNNEELHSLSAVSPKWFSLCQRMHWKKVAIVPSYDMDRFSIDPLLYDYSDFVQLDHLLSLDKTVHLLTYEELHKLASVQEFQDVAAKYTTEIWVYYRYMNVGDVVPGENAQAFDTISRIFTRVSKARISYNLSFRDATFVAFQKMLNKWKPTVQFYLGVNAHHLIGNEAYLDVAYMNIKELYISRLSKDDEYDSEDEDEDIPRTWISGTEAGRFGTHEIKRRVPADPSLLRARAALPVPISRTRGTSPTEWNNLERVGQNLTRLSLLVECDAFQSFNVPQSVRYLHLTSCGEITTAPTLKVSQGVETLSVAEYYDIITKNTPSVLTWLDLKEAKQVKELTYAAPEFTDALQRTVNAVSGSLERLAVSYHAGRALGPSKFKALATSGLGVRELRVRIATFDRTHGDYDSYLGHYPVLERLVLDLFAFDDSSPNDRRFLRNLLAKFLRASPSLCCLQLRTNEELTEIGEWMSWTCRDVYGTSVVHELNLSKFKTIVH